MIKSLEINIQEYFWTFIVSMDTSCFFFFNMAHKLFFFNMAQKALAINAKINTVNYFEIKNFCLSKDTIKRVKCKPKNRKRYLY